MLRLLLLLIPALVLASTEENNNTTSTREARDSYLDAYKESHGSGSPTKFAEPPQKIQLQASTVYAKPVVEYAKPGPSYPPIPPKPAASYLPSKPASPVYLPKPSQEYGEPSYLKPSTEHLEPTDSYGVSPVKYMDKLPQMYGIPHFHHHYQIPEPEPEALEKEHGGFDLKTVFKFLLKIIVLKKIVKFVYIVMYLLFMPKFNILGSVLSFFDKDKDGEKEKPDSDEKPDHDDDDDDMTDALDDDDDDSFFRKSRNISKVKLDQLANTVAKAISTPPTS